MRPTLPILALLGACAMLAIEVATTFDLSPGSIPLVSLAYADDTPLVAEPAHFCAEESDGVRTLAEQLRHRSVELDEREQTIAARETALTDAGKILDARLTALTTLQAELATRLDQDDAQRNARIAALVKMVESGRPNAVAPMVGAMEPSLAVAVIDRMNRTKAGKLLAELPATQAASLAARLTRPLALDLP
jgi:flagellar motility protein MotE (MotC chaperone)